MNLLLLLQLICPPSLKCPNELPLLRTTPSVSVVANPNAPAKWFTSTMLIELAAFEGIALKTNNHTISQWSQEESKRYPIVKWSLVSGMAILCWHLVWGFPW